jgi:CRISPR-associated endonuclease/helicase Cas3
MKQNQTYLFSLLDELPNWSQKYLGEKISVTKDAVEVENCKDAMEFMRPLIPSREREQFISWFSNRFYLILLRGLTIACDHLSSAGKYGIHKGIRDVCHKLMESKKITSIRSFQNRTEKLSLSGYLAAPTGTGKTAAALLWCGNNQDSGRRVFYVLPYTASINAMRRELKDSFGEENVGMLHHKARYFIYKDLCEQFPYEKAIQLTKGIATTTKKIYRPIKVLTPYQIVKAFYGVKGFESMLSEMTGGLFVFDEIHCYDPRTVALILKSIEELNKIEAKFLFMSATLPSFLRKMISDKIGNLPFIKLNSADEKENKILMQARHRIFLENSNITDSVDKIRSYLSSNKKVLVVCNEVRIAQKMYNTLKSHARKARLIHGRFITKDRERIERDIADADLLVGTQAIEVSLNFDFDVIFTEPAPIDALLQRFGRVNRFGRSKEPADAYVFKKGSVSDEYNIYDSDRVKKTLDILPNGEPLTNRKASELVEEIYKEGYSEKEQREYKQAYEAFSYVIKQLPVFDESEFKDEFFELIKSRKVVPIKFKRDYIVLRDEKRYLDMMGYEVPISLEQFFWLKRENRIECIDHTLFANAEYYSDLGLILDKKEIEKENTII